MVQRLRLTAAEVAPAVAEVRALYRAHDQSSATWEIGSSARPLDLEVRLCTLGMVPDPEEPLALCMVLRQSLPVSDSPVVVRRIERLEDAKAAAAIYQRCFGGLPVDTAEVARRHAECARQPENGRWLAWLKGEPIAAAEAVFVDQAVVLNGAAVVPEARGRGSYRALIAERFLEAERRGTPILVTQAGSMSRLILARLGFSAVAEVRILIDTF